MATQITATTPRTRPAPRLGVLEVATLAAIAGGFHRDVTIDSQAYGVGYPLHGGLAGPSRVGQVSSVAGPSRLLSAVALAGHYGPGYPLSGGLAGPSRVDGGD